MKRFVVVLLLVVLAVLPSVVSSDGLDPDQLDKAGWTCINVPGLGVHCFPPGSSASSATIQVMVFDTDNPGAVDAPFLGSELLVRKDIYERGKPPCPQDEVHFLTPPAVPPPGYYACHHYDTSAHD